MSAIDFSAFLNVVNKQISKSMTETRKITMQEAHLPNQVMPPIAIIVEAFYK